MTGKPTYEELEQKVNDLQDVLKNRQMPGIDNNKELFRLAFENANIGMCLVDLKGNMFKVNEEMVNIFGYSAQELEKMNVNDITHPDYMNISPLFIRQAAEGVLSHSIFEKKYFHKNGGLVICIVTSSVVYGVNNKASFFISHVQDITDKKNAERILLDQKEELQKLNAEKDKFFSIIAHDLMNPFSSIVGFSDLLAEFVNEKKYDDVGKYSAIIQDSSQRALSLLKNLMEWAQSKTGRMEFNPVRFEIIDLINETELLFSDLAKQKTISIIKKIPQQTTIFADWNMLSTVLRNLVSNAIKFTKPGGEIVISFTDKQDEFFFSICDNGVGISKNRIEKLFNLDGSYSTNGTNQEKGTGLGLILCKEFIEKHNGKIWVESTEDKGSNFKFTIPVLHNSNK